MFHKICFFAMIACFSGVAFADLRQSITSEVFSDYGQEVTEYVQEDYVEPEVPVWPLPGSEADVEIVCDEAMGCGEEERIVNRIGSGLIIENNINTVGTGWSGGPNISNNMPIPEGFDYECANNAEMPLLRREMMEDDGGSVLAISRSSRKTCGTNSADSYAVFAQRAGFAPETTCNAVADAGGIAVAEVSVNGYVEEEISDPVQDQVRSWVVADGQTLREVLQSWCDEAGWDLVWTTARE